MRKMYNESMNKGVVCHIYSRRTQHLPVNFRNLSFYDKQVVAIKKTHECLLCAG